jgi:nicotinate-nucleotide pyrophosphorylase
LNTGRFRCSASLDPDNPLTNTRFRFLSKSRGGGVAIANRQAEIMMRIASEFARASRSRIATPSPAARADAVRCAGGYSGRIGIMNTIILAIEILARQRQRLD